MCEDHDEDCQGSQNGQNRASDRLRPAVVRIDVDVWLGRYSSAAGSEWLLRGAGEKAKRETIAMTKRARTGERAIGVAEGIHETGVFSV